MSDLNRKKFEAWFIQKANKDTGMCMSMADIAGKRGPKGDYDSYGYLHGCWVGWQASRECLVIELPPEPEYPDEPDDAIDDSYMDEYHSAIRMRNACRDSIHAAGVKTK